MTKTTSRHLLDILAEVPDSRNNRGKRHPLSAILGLAVIAMMCGNRRSYAAIAEIHHSFKVFVRCLETSRSGDCSYSGSAETERYPRKRGNRCSVL